MGVKDVGIGTKKGVGSFIFMMRVGIFILKGLNGGKFSVTNLRENE